MTAWQVFTDADGSEGYRAVVDGYLVFLREAPPEGQRGRKGARVAGGWLVHVLMPEDERRKAFLAGPGFDRPVPLEEAKRVAEGAALEGRGKLERQAKRRELEAKAERPPKPKPKKPKKRR